MSCPFKHLWSGEASNGQNTDVQDPSRNSAAPSDAAGKAETAVNVAEVHVSPPSVCPAGYGRAPPPAASAGPGSRDGGATCPLGFGRSKGPKLSSLHCIICKSFLYDCVRTSCGHRYCAHCIAGVRDCPSCGADIEAVDPDPATQSTVETFLDTHAGEVSLWELEGTAHGAAGLPPPGDGRDAASFLLQVALRALAAGNLPSALARLGKCKERLEAQLANARQTPNPPYATDSVPYSGNNNREESGPSDDVPARLGAVCGCLGDCARAAGDAATALEHYQDSAGYLREAASDNDDAAQALSVTLNKIAEVHHAQGDVAAALPFYLESLDLRKARYKQYSTNVSNCIGGNTGVSAECIGAALDVAMGEAKVADALEAGADAQQAQQHLAAGKEILGTLEKCMEAAPEGLRRKHAMLVAHFDQATK